MTIYSASATTVLDAHGVGMAFGAGPESRPVLQDVSFAVRQEEFVCIVGPSGAGKTTLLRCVAGLYQPTSGEVQLSGQRITGPPKGMSVVFQDYSRSLFPWMRVGDNVGVPLRVAGVSREERRHRVELMLDDVGLADTARLYPWQLSGGMQQRVAIARALISEPRVLLMDEPFASVDAQTRFSLEDLALTIRRTQGVSIVLITHDIDESVYLADRVLVLSGRPAGITDEIAIDLGDQRDQIGTRAEPRFAQLRTEVFEAIRSAA